MNREAWGIEDQVIRVMDMAGKVLYKRKATIDEGNNRFMLELSAVAKCTYILQLNTLDNAVNRILILK